MSRTCQVEVVDYVSEAIVCREGSLHQVQLVLQTALNYAPAQTYARASWILKF